MEINNDIYSFCFWLTLGLIGFYFTILFLRRVVIAYIYAFEKRRLLEVITNGLYRINIVCINIAVSAYIKGVQNLGWEWISKTLAGKGFSNIEAVLRNTPLTDKNKDQIIYDIIQKIKT